MKFKLSIVTPAYNSAKTIEKTLKSVASQEQSQDLEYIVVDGGSKDTTLTSVEKYANYISLVISEPDRGPYDAMNKGVCKASGDVIGIINSDDWYNQGAIKRVRHEFEMNPDIDILYSAIDNYYEGTYVATFVPGDLDKLFIRFTLNHPSCFIKKSVYDRLGLYDLSYKIAADYDFILRAYMAGCKFHCVDTSLASYSLNGMSSSTRFRDRAGLIQESWRVGEKFVEQLPPYARSQRQQAYLRWIISELVALPARRYLKPPLARKVKALLTQFTGKPVSDSFGKW